MATRKRPRPPAEKEARAAYESELDVCFIVRMPRVMRDAIEAHGEWMRAHYQVERISLAAAARNLFLRGLILSPAERRARRALRGRGQLELFPGLD